jgi:hypothetical protein
MFRISLLFLVAAGLCGGLRAQDIAAKDKLAKMRADRLAACSTCEKELSAIADESTIEPLLIVMRMVWEYDSAPATSEADSFAWSSKKTQEYEAKLRRLERDLAARLKDKGDDIHLRSALCHVKAEVIAASLSRRALYEAGEKLKKEELEADAAEMDRLYQQAMKLLLGECKAGRESVWACTQLVRRRQEALALLSSYRATLALRSESRFENLQAAVKANFEAREATEKRQVEEWKALAEEKAEASAELRELNERLLNLYRSRAQWQSLKLAAASKVESDERQAARQQMMDSVAAGVRLQKDAIGAWEEKRLPLYACWEIYDGKIADTARRSYSPENRILLDKTVQKVAQQIHSNNDCSATDRSVARLLETLVAQDAALVQDALEKQAARPPAKGDTQR